jgi:phosphoglycolate phosphatase
LLVIAKMIFYSDLMNRERVDRMPVKLMVFDLDGTLADTGEDLAFSVNRALEILGLPSRPESVLLGFVGDGVHKLLERALGEANRGRLPEALERFKTVYGEHLLDRTRLYPGVTDVLRHFGDKPKVLITNKTLDFSVTLCTRLGIARFFEEIIGGDSREFMKPDPRLLAPLFERFDARPTQTLVIGDGHNDILLAQNAGARSCAFLNGIGRRETLLALRPDFVIERMADLLEIAT